MDRTQKSLHAREDPSIATLSEIYRDIHREVNSRIEHYLAFMMSEHFKSSLRNTFLEGRMDSVPDKQHEFSSFLFRSTSDFKENIKAILNSTSSRDFWSNFRDNQ